MGVDSIMQHIKTHKIHPLRVRPGDSINLHYSYEEPENVINQRWIKVDDFTEEMTIDTIIAYRIETGEYGLKGGRALMFGEDDGTYAHLPVNDGRKYMNKTTS